MLKFKILFTAITISFILCISTDYGIVTYLLSDSKRYSSDTELLNSLHLENLPNDKEKIFKIYTEIESLEHKFTFYSVFENPISVIFELIIYEPLFKRIKGRESQFINTLREPYLLFNVGGGVCYQTAIAMTQLAEQAGFRGRVIALEGHAVAEIYYDNAWHLFDADMGVIFKENEHILSYNEIINKPNLLYNTLEEKEWEKKLFDYIANTYITTTDNFFLNDEFFIYSYETYIEIYYFLTRLFSYMLYILIFILIIIFPSYYQRICK
jgi:hypothetical protein